MGRISGEGVSVACELERRVYGDSIKLTEARSHGPVRTVPQQCVPNLHHPY
jgi:hypothetical protein